MHLTTFNGLYLYITYDNTRAVTKCPLANLNPDGDPRSVLSTTDSTYGLAFQDNKAYIVGLSGIIVRCTVTNTGDLTPCEVSNTGVRD